MGRDDGLRSHKVRVRISPLVPISKDAEIAQLVEHSLFESLKRHVSNLIADLYTDRYGYILIVDFKVIASV